MDTKEVLEVIEELHQRCNVLLDKSIKDYQKIVTICDRECIFKSDNIQAHFSALDSENSKMSTLIRRIESIAYGISADINKLLHDIKLILEEVLAPYDEYPILMKIFNRKYVSLLKLDAPIPFGIFVMSAEDIKKLDTTRLNLAYMRKKIEGSTKQQNKSFITSIEYQSSTSTLVINGEPIDVGKRSSRNDFLLRVFFKNKRQNLLKCNIDDMDVLDALEEEMPGKYPTHREAMKYILDGYKLLNNRIRYLIPHHEDLIIRINRGFALNPKLKQ